MRVVNEVGLSQVAMLGCLTLALIFISCSNDDEALAIGDFHEGGIIFYLDGTIKKIERSSPSPRI